MQPLPIGIQNFRKIIEENFLYVDKTKQIYPLIEKSGAYFLSRPRRFGKSLTLSTFKEIFEGNKELFEGLYISQTNYEWKKHPIVRVDFSAIKTFTKEDLIKGILSFLNQTAEQYELQLKEENYDQRFRELIYKLSKQGKIVILIDEYDKPIIDHLTKPELAIEMREILKGFYTIIKASDEYLRFVFLTGVSKFSKAGVFSGLNNLNDISMNSKYSTIVGITEEELVNYFQDYLIEFANKRSLSRDAILEKIRYWYNGYCFSAECERVYNPFSTLLLFDNMEFKNYWFETATPTFLVELAKKKDFYISELPVKAEEIYFSTYEVDNLEVIPLLYQTGYLTVKAYDPERQIYTLDYPNYEVKNSLLKYFLRSYSQKSLVESKLYDLIDSLGECDFEKFFFILRSIFADIAYDLHIKQEKYYQTIFYLIFTLIGLKVSAEVKTNVGRIDVVIADREIFVFEFKLDGTKEEALEQIKKQKYYEKYLGLGKRIYLLGVEFKDRNVGEYLVEMINVQ